MNVQTGKDSRITKTTKQIMKINYTCYTGKEKEIFSDFLKSLKAILNAIRQFRVL